MCYVYFMLLSPLLIMQSVETPNGLIAHMFGPVEGRRHDAFMLGMSDLLGKLRKFNLPNGEPYVIYGDPANGLSRNILSPFRGAHIIYIYSSRARVQQVNESCSHKCGMRLWENSSIFFVSRF